MKEISLNEYAAVLNSSDYPIVVLLFYAYHAPLFCRIQTRSPLSPGMNITPINDPRIKG